jgi:hypothetical protein
MAIMFLGIFILGAAVLVRGLILVSTARGAWTARSMAGTATIVECRRLYTPGLGERFLVTVRFSDAGGQPRTARLPGPYTYRQFDIGENVSIRFDPARPESVYLSEHFAGAGKAIVLIAFGGALMAVGFAVLVQRL